MFAKLSVEKVSKIACKVFESKSEILMLAKLSAGKEAWTTATLLKKRKIKSSFLIFKIESEKETRITTTQKKRAKARF